MNLYTEMGGGEHALLHLLKRLDRDRFETIMIFNGEGPFVDAARSAGARIEILPFETVMLRQLLTPRVARSAYKGSRELSRFFAKKQADVILCSDVLSLLLVAPAVSRRKIPVVYNVIFQYEWPRLLTFNALAAWNVARIVANSEKVRRHVLEKTLFLSRRVETIWPGVDSTQFRPRRPGERNMLRHELRIPEGVSLVGMAGRFDPAKGHLIFLRAAAEILRKRRDVMFVVAGGLLNSLVIPSLKVYHDRVMQYFANLGLEGYVKFLGHRADMPALMRSLDVYVCPSVSEGFGLTVVEALASGVPVVASRAVGALDLLANQPLVSIAETGDSSSFASSIIAALNPQKILAPPPTREMGWDAYARRFEQVFETVSQSTRNR